MCRFLAQISTQPERADEFIVHSEFSLLKQSGLKADRLQKDGWGIGYFNGSRPVVIKSPRPAYEEPAAVAAASERAVSKVTIGHIRAASNPRKIPEKLLLSAENTQPFENGEWIFAHNGTVEIPDEVASRLGPLKKRVKSLNDSEVYFWQFFKFLSKTGNPAAAFELCVEELWDLWKDCAHRYPEKSAPYTSLNAVAARENALYAFCHSVFVPTPNEALSNSRQPWYTLNFSRRGNALIIASEGLDRGRWDLCADPEIISASISEGRLDFSRKNYSFQNGRIIGDR